MSVGDRTHQVDVVLRDGSTVAVRPVRTDDLNAMAEFLRGLSTLSYRYRFFGLGDPESAARGLVEADGSDVYGLVALTGLPSRIVGHAEFSRMPGAPAAEAAFAVADQLQGHGLGTLLLAHLAERAHASGIEVFEAEVLQHNRRMIRMFQASGFPAEVRQEGGSQLVRLPTSLSPSTVAAFAERSRTAAVAMARRLLSPDSVAVVGASRSRGTVGGEVLHHLREGGYAGRLYVVNRAADEVQGLPALRSVADLPEPVDLAVIAVPAAAVIEVVRACGERGVRTVAVLSAGFAELGGPGHERQDAVVEVCRATGMRLVGPNCLGVLNTAEGARLNATFATGMPSAGGVGMLSQSGGLGIALLAGARNLGVGISSFVSVGNRADVSSNDLLRFWEQDPATAVVGLYLESFGNPRTFARVARRISRMKPVVAVKSGRGRAGARAAGSHTGALMAASDVTVDALFEQAGVIRTDTMSELFDVTKLLAGQPVPEGRRVGIISNVGGPGILCADACEAQGLEVPELPGLRERLRMAVAPEASLGNPVDLLAAATADQFGQALEQMVEEPELDAVIVIHIDSGIGGVGSEVNARIRAVAARRRRQVPILTVLMSADDRRAAVASAEPGAPPVFDYPEAAAVALAHAVRYGRWRRRPRGRVPEFPDARPARASALLAEAVVAGPGWLPASRVAALLESYGLPLLPTHSAPGPAEAGRAARELGGLVALKAEAPGIVHKTEAGAVRLNLMGAERVEAEARSMAGRLAEAGHEVSGFLVQPMAPAGVEMLVGSTADPQFGPVVVCGLGGTAAEVHGDVSVRLTPLTDLDAQAMVRELRALPLLEGYRGAGRSDIGALEDLVLRVAAMVYAHPQIVELDCNPVMVWAEGAVVAGGRVRVAPAPARLPWPSLRAPPPTAIASDPA
jgi:acetate---CoA ligase (ADP-forming)